MGKPLLSICIPTYNRAEFLKKSLESLICQKRFEETEVVISDNCSTDNTKDVCDCFSRKYPNIVYHRNDENIVCGNIPLSIKLANGEARKVSNDTILYADGAVERMLDLIAQYRESRELIYILNKRLKQNTGYGSIVRCTSAEEFLYKVSYNVTWIASMLIWEEYCGDYTESMEIYEQNEASCLAQIPFLIDILKHNSNSVIFTEPIMKGQSLPVKNLSYGLYEVFYKNYMRFLDGFLKEELISEETRNYLRKDLLLNFYPCWVAAFQVNPERYILSDENLPERLKEEYGDEAYYSQYEKSVTRYVIRAHLGRIKRRLKRILSGNGNV